MIKNETTAMLTLATLSTEADVVIEQRFQKLDPMPYLSDFTQPLALNTLRNEGTLLNHQRRTNASNRLQTLMANFLLLIRKNFKK